MHFILTLVLMPIVALLYVAYADTYGSLGKASVCSPLECSAHGHANSSCGVVSREGSPGLLNRNFLLFFISAKP